MHKKSFNTKLGNHTDLAVAAGLMELLLAFVLAVMMLHVCARLESKSKSFCAQWNKLLG